MVRVECYDMIYYEDKAAGELRAVVQELTDADVLTGCCWFAAALFTHYWWQLLRV